jgi:hypothetical protein
LYFVALAFLWSSALLSTGLGTGGRNSYRASLPVQLVGLVALVLFASVLLLGFFLFQWWKPPTIAVLAIAAAVWSERFVPSRIRAGVAVVLALAGMVLAYGLLSPSRFLHLL